MAVPPIVTKAIATAATDKRTWKFIAMLIAAVLMPVILCVMSVAILAIGAESSSVSLMEYSFNSEELPSTQTRNSGRRWKIRGSGLWNLTKK